MNSISSKNDFDKCKAKLEELGVWEYFIFPAINWSSKGEQIKNLIDSANLRDVNVLFIDDNHLNLEEAKFYNPNIKTATPEILDNLLEIETLKGKEDRNHTRLLQYKVLEEKAVARKEYSSNNDFLFASNIQVREEALSEDKLQRVLEMIERTNQLNYTKKRIIGNTLKELLSNNDYENVCVFVKDNYGDYGLAGFYSYKKCEHYLEHFLFSCRILNLGVEQWIYANLNFPKLEVIGPISVELNKAEKPSWINQKNIDKNNKNKVNATKQLKILLKGNCDIVQISHYIMDDNISVTTDFLPLQKNNFTIKTDSTLLLRQSLELSDGIKQELYKNYMFVTPETYNNKIFTEDVDIIVFSLMQDYLSPLYKDKITGTLMPSVLGMDVFSGEPNSLVKKLFKENNIVDITADDVRYFQENLEYERYVTEEDLKSNLEFLIEHINKPIIFLNGPEIPYPGEPIETNKRFIALNKVADEFVNSHENCYLLDVRKYVKKQSDMTDFPTHYLRQIYLNLSNDLLKILNETANVKIKYNSLLNKYFLSRIIDDLKVELKNLRRQIFWIRWKKNEKFIRIFGLNIQISDK